MEDELVITMSNVHTYEVHMRFPHDNFNVNTVEQLHQAGALRIEYHPMGVSYRVMRKITVTNAPSVIVVAPYKPPSPKIRKNHTCTEVTLRY